MDGELRFEGGQNNARFTTFLKIHLYIDIFKLTFTIYTWQMNLL